jgi:hypothetical protein
MSYDIFYGKQFVKLQKTGEVISVLLSGSSNCFEYGQGGRNGRRTRDWCSMGYYNRKDKLSEKPDIILKNLDADLRKHIRQNGKATAYSEAVKPSAVKDCWGYYIAVAIGGGSCSDTSWSRYRSFFENGIRGALTVESLVQKRVYPMFSAYGDFGQPHSIPLLTEKGYFEELKKWKAWRETHPGHNFSLTFSPMSTDEVLDRLRKPKVQREHTRVEEDHYFVLADAGGQSLLRYTSRGFRYSWTTAGGRKYRTEQEAEKYRKELVEKGKYKSETWKVKRIDSPATFYV